MSHKLKELVKALNLNESEDKDFVTFEGTRYKMTNLPTWGAAIDDTHNVWSWDETHCIKQDLNGGGRFIILLRGDV